MVSDDILMGATVGDGIEKVGVTGLDIAGMPVLSIPVFKGTLGGKGLIGLNCEGAPGLVIGLPGLVSGFDWSGLAGGD
jgi:hypothetical protein